jgi:glycosyltransferase involved in cell wall biosynthesis
MRILFVGNLGNTGYRFVKWLRQNEQEACLTFPSNIKHERSFPEWEDPRLQSNYPEWIIPYTEKKFPFLFINRELRSIASRFDIVLTTGKYIVPALALNKPVVFLPVGGDLTRIPFENETTLQVIHSHIYRSRFKKVKRILTDQEDCIWAARLLGQGNKINRFPFLIDMDSVKNNINTTLFEYLKNKYRDYDYLFLNPSRKNMDPRMMDYKGSEKVLYAFKEFISHKPVCSVKMISALHGQNAEEFKQMVFELDLDKYIDFTGHMNLPDLHAYMALDNAVVFDQFTTNLNALGGLQREALSFGKHVVTSTNVLTKEFAEAYGSNCPLLTARDSDEIFKRMMEICNTPLPEYSKQKERITSWARKNIHWENRISELVQILQEIYLEN